MELIGIKHSIRKITELGIGAIAIVTLILAGCGGGGVASLSPLSDAISVVALLGQFSQGATVRVRDRNGNVLDTQKIDATGKAQLTVSHSAPTPLLIEAGITGDTYFDEKNGIQTISGVGIRAFVPSTAVSQVGVTALTEIAAGGLLDASGNPKSGITAASAIGANTAVGQLFGVADPTIQPTVVSGVGATNTLGSTSADQYALKLAALAYMAGTGQNAADTNAQDVAHTLSANLNAGTGTSAASAVQSMQTQLLTTNLVSNAQASTVASALTIPVSTTTLSTLTGVASSYALSAENNGSSISTIISVAQNAASSVEADLNQGLSAASAVAQVQTGAASGIPPITQATTLFTSLRTNAQLLGNSGKAGFIQNQASAVQADFTASTNAFSEAKDFLKFAINAVGLLRNGNVTTTPTLTTVYANGQPWPCGSVAVASSGVASGEVVCQWRKQNPAGTQVSTHQLTITGPIPATPPAGPSTQIGTYTWVDTIIGTSGSASGVGGAIITLGNPSYGQYGIVASPYYTTSPGLTATGITGATGTLSISPTTMLSFDSNGNLNAGLSATVTLIGNTLGAGPAGTTTPTSYDGQVPLNSSGFAMGDHIYHNWTGIISADSTGKSDTLSLTGTTTRWSIPTSTTPGTPGYAGVIINSISLGTGSNVVDNASTVSTKASPVSAYLVLTATTPNYSFNGTVNIPNGGFGQNANTMCTQGWDQNGICLGPVSSPNWYPKTVSFTGSVAGINTSSSLGTFMTTTGTGLVVTLDQSNYNPNNPTSSSNYQIDSATFNGSIIDGSSTYKITNLVATNGNTLAAYNPVNTLALTYTDPSNNTVTVNLAGTTGATTTGTASLGAINISINGSTNSGKVYYGNLPSALGTPGTLIGIIGSPQGFTPCVSGLVCFTDGSTQSLQ